MSESSLPRPRPCLRLFSADVDPDAAEALDDLSPFISLSAFFERWYVPVVALGEKGSTAATIVSYRESLAWWAALTGDPPLSSLDQFTVAQFLDGLRRATFRRRPRGREYPLSRQTQAKHAGQVRAVLRRAGPSCDAASATAGLLERLPKISARRPKSKPRPAFALSQARAIVGARWQIFGPHVPGIQSSAWWLAYLSLKFYAGLRDGTVLALTHRMVAPRGGSGPFSPPGVPAAGDDWLEIPGEIVKTEQPLTRLLHPAAAAAIIAVRGARGPDDLIVPWPHHRRHLRARHERLQQLAGLASDRWLSPHAWRRTHAQEMTVLGSQSALQLAQWSLDHDDARTTRDSYHDPEQEFLRRLPLLDLGQDARQRTLFN